MPLELHFSGTDHVLQKNIIDSWRTIHQIHVLIDRVKCNNKIQFIRVYSIILSGFIDDGFYFNRWSLHEWIECKHGNTYTYHQITGKFQVCFFDSSIVYRFHNCDLNFTCDQTESIPLIFLCYQNIFFHLWQYCLYAFQCSQEKPAFAIIQKRRSEIFRW